MAALTRTASFISLAESTTVVTSASFSSQSSLVGSDDDTTIIEAEGARPRGITITIAFSGGASSTRVEARPGEAAA